jgi:hypothetical protein
VRIAFWVYGLVYVMFEVVGHQLDSVGWQHLTSLDVAEALTDAVLTVTVIVAVLVAGQLGLDRWRRSMAAWHAEQALLSQLVDEPSDLETITVESWREEPLALTAGPSWTPKSPARYPMPDGPLDGGPPYW